MIMRVRSLAASACCCALAASSAGGCVSGMRYKMPMPSSLTLGTVREDGATLAADRPAAGKAPTEAASPTGPTTMPAVGQQANTAGRPPAGVAMLAP